MIEFDIKNIWNESMLLKSTIKAGYTATPVLLRWAGAIFKFAKSFGQNKRGTATAKPPKKVKCDKPTDGWTNRRRTYGPMQHQIGEKMSSYTYMGM